MPMASNKYLVVTVIIYTQYFLVIPNYNPIRSVLSPSAGDFDEDPGERAAKVFEDRRAQTRQAQSAGPDDLLIFLVDFSMKETINLGGTIFTHISDTLLFGPQVGEGEIGQIGKA